MPPLAHSKLLGGSSAARRIACPGSYSLEKDAPEQPSSSYAREGTALHTVMESLLMDWTATPGDNLPSITGTTVDGEFISQDLVTNKIEPAFAAVRELSKRAGGFDFVTEARVTMGDEWDGDAPFGTVDVLARGKGDGKLYVIDFKFGAGVQVGVEKNVQLGFYAGCALMTPEVADLVGDEKTPIVLCIIQPVGGDTVLRTWETDDAWVLRLMAGLSDTIDEAVSPNPRFSTGDWCRWCKGRLNCDTFSVQGEQSTALVRTAATGLAGLDAQTLAAALNAIPEVTKRINALEELARDRIRSGITVPGWGMKPKRATRKYTDLEVAETKVRAKLKVGEAYTRKLITPAQAERKLGKKYYAKHLAPVVEAVSSGMNLVPTDETTPAHSGLARLKALNKEAT